MADNQIAGEQDIFLSANQQYIPDVDNEESNLGSRGSNIRRSWRTNKLKKQCRVSGLIIGTKEEEYRNWGRWNVLL